MSHNEKHREIDPIAQNIIRRKARKLMRRGGFSSSDLPDLEQDLSLHLLQRMSAFDPRRGDWAVFVTVVITSWGAKLLRTRFAAKRDYRRNRPLLTASQSCQPGDDLEQLELLLDVQQALQRLPGDLRPIAERLQHITIAELACALGVPRTTLYEQIKRIRRRFQRMGLKK